MKVESINIKDLIFKIFGVIVLFLYIYMPLFNRLNLLTTTILPFFILVVAFLSRFNIIIKKLRKKEILFFAAAILFLVLFCFWHDLDSNSPVQLATTGSRFSITYLRIFLSILLPSVGICALLQFSSGSAKPIKAITVINAFFIISFIQFVIVVIMLLSPSIRDYINFNIVPISGKLFDGQNTSRLYDLRGYGIAGDPLFSYPLFNGFVVATALWFTHKKNILYIGVAIYSVLPILLNARVGLIAIPTFLIAILVIDFKKITSINIKYLFSTIFLLLSIATLLILIYNNIDLILPTTSAEWAKKGIDELIFFFQYFSTGYSENFETTTANVLISEQWKMPASENLILGDGSYIFETQSNFSSDVGYIRLLHFGGIFMSLLVYLSFGLFFVFCFMKSKSPLIKGTILIGILISFAANFKGLVFTYENAFLRSLILLSVFVIFEQSSSLPYKTAFRITKSSGNI